jgi:predicted metal-dependent peptidase
MYTQIDQLIRKAKLKLFTNTLFFFGMMANKFTWEVEPLSPQIEGFVRFNIEDSSKIESGAIHVNELFLLKPDYTYNNLVFILCHELLHILNKHGIRKNDRDWDKWNIACDHVIEVFLRKMQETIKPYNNQYNIIPELYNNKSDCTAEYAYDWIINHPNSIKINPTADDMAIDVMDGNGNYMFTVITNLGGITSALDVDENIKAALTDQIVAEARAIFENIKSKGDAPSYMITYLDKILKVEIPWETLVEKAIKTNVIMKPDERTWRCLNKFYIPHKINLPGYALIEDTEGTGVLIIGVDSSGSISDKNLKKFSSVIENSMKYFKTIKVIVHDTIIHQRKDFNKDNIGDFYNFIKKQGYQGRGGTSHKYFFDEIQTEYWEKDKDELSMVISLTDMASDIDYHYKKYEWIKNNLPLVFIITHDGNLLTFDSTFGNITQIKIN